MTTLLSCCCVVGAGLIVLGVFLCCVEPPPIGERTERDSGTNYYCDIDGDGGSDI